MQKLKSLRGRKRKHKTEVKAAPAKQNINGLKPYAQVITPKAKSSFGFLTVHKVDNNYFFEIPDSMLNRDILIVNRISKAPTSRQKSRVGYPGDILGSKVIRFENKDNKRILVREYSYRERSENKDGMFQSVRNSNTQPIVANFGIETIKKDSLTRNYVINVSVFLQKENPLFSFDADSKEYIGLLNMVGEGTYIDTLKAFPKNIEISTTVTYQSKKRYEQCRISGNRKSAYTTDLRTEQFNGPASRSTDESQTVRSACRLLHRWLYRFRQQPTRYRIQKTYYAMASGAKDEAAICVESL